MTDRTGAREPLRKQPPGAFLRRGRAPARVVVAALPIWVLLAPLPCLGLGEGVLDAAPSSQSLERGSAGGPASRSAVRSTPGESVPGPCGGGARHALESDCCAGPVSCTVEATAPESATVSPGPPSSSLAAVATQLPPAPLPRRLDHSNSPFPRVNPPLLS